LAVIVSGVLCILISAAMPAMAMYVHSGLQPADFPNLSPAAAYVHVEHVQGLRDGTLRELNLNAAEGIITFPSYHATLAIIFLVAFWSVPLLRWPGVVLNLALIAGTPIDGGHYFVDLGAGMAIAVLSVLAARSLSLPSVRSQAAITVPVQV
jgi:membrane-associated phospholipid phosphatase